MPKYTAVRDTWLSHECRLVKAGETFETTFPKVGGKAMVLADNLMLAKTEKEVKSVPADEGDPAADTGGGDESLV